MKKLFIAALALISLVSCETDPGYVRFQSNCGVVTAVKRIDAASPKHVVLIDVPISSASLSSASQIYSGIRIETTENYQLGDTVYFFNQ